MNLLQKSSRKNIKKIIRNDIILGIGLLFAALCLWLILWYVVPDGRADELVVVISVDGDEYGRYPLGADAIIEIGEGAEVGMGVVKGAEVAVNVKGYNRVIIDNGSVRMEEADCPDKLCVHQGRIYKTGQTIICLPNRVVITIRGGDKEYDGIAR